MGTRHCTQHSIPGLRRLSQGPRSPPTAHLFSSLSWTRHGLSQKSSNGLRQDSNILTGTSVLIRTLWNASRQVKVPTRGKSDVATKEKSLLSKLEERGLINQTVGCVPPFNFPRNTCLSIFLAGSAKMLKSFLQTQPWVHTSDWILPHHHCTSAT